METDPEIRKLVAEGWEDPPPTLADHRPWMDHCYVEAEDGRPVFVAEPYELTDETILDLASLHLKGWGIEISSDRARWYPGHTVRIELRHDER